MVARQAVGGRGLLGEKGDDRDFGVGVGNARMCRRVWGGGEAAGLGSRRLDLERGDYVDVVVGSVVEEVEVVVVCLSIEVAFGDRGLENSNLREDGEEG